MGLPARAGGRAPDRRCSSASRSCSGARAARQWAELLTYAAMAAGLLVSIGVSGMRYRLNTGFEFEQARYLLPFLALYARPWPRRPSAPGRASRSRSARCWWRWRPSHGLFAQLLVISRFYG